MRLSGLRASALLCAALSLAAPVWALKSNSADFSNTRSAFDGGGGQMAANTFSQTNSISELATTTLTATSFMARSGMIPSYFYPARIADLRAYGCSSAQVTLQWTAPGNDGTQPKTKARAYLIRMSNDPLQSPANSETLFYGDTAVTPPTPSVEGTTETVTIGGLTNGVTYYFAIMAVEADLGTGPLSPGGTFFIGSSLGPPPSNFSALTGFKIAEMGWSLTVSAIPGCTPVGYQLARSTDDASFSVLGDTVGAAYFDYGTLAGTTYYYKLIGLDSGNNPMTAPAYTLVYVHSAPATPPLRFDLQVFASSNTLSWQQPVAHDIGVRFLDAAHARNDEVCAYRVWRSTALLNANWTLLTNAATGNPLPNCNVGLSTATLSFTDFSPVAGAYYKVTAHNVTDNSLDSWIRDVALQDGYAVSPDRKSHLYVPHAVLGQVYSSPSAYWVRTSSFTVAQGVFNTADWEIYDQYAQKDNFYKFPDNVQVRLSYQTDATGHLVPAGAGVQSASANTATQDQASLFWNNGADWVKMYGAVDTTNQWVVAGNHFGGQYELRALARVADVDFDISNISNKFLTPNGDGKNDSVVFTLSNPKQSEITGKIFDVTGRHVADMTKILDMSQTTQMKWDGTANGSIVPSGVYVYQLSGDGKTFNGTLVVIR